jgi:hypothetical protein
MSKDSCTPRRRSNPAGGEERKSRNQLFSQRRKKSSSTASEAQSIQKSLLRTQFLLKNELQRVTQVASAIEEDETILQQTMNHHKSLNTKNAQHALTSLQRAQRHEQRVLMASIIFFCTIVFYVMWSRLLPRLDFMWSWWL